MERLAELPQRKLVHSVGTPVGGTRLGDRRQLPLLREAIARLGAPWCSEHLSFSDEGLAFGAYLASTPLDRPFLDDVLAFELALLRASISGETTTVRFGADPAALPGALAEGRMPEAVAAGDFAFEVSPQAVQ